MTTIISVSSNAFHLAVAEDPKIPGRFIVRSASADGCTELHLRLDTLGLERLVSAGQQALQHADFMAESRRQVA